MDDFRAMARNPEFRRKFEKLLYLAALRGDADLVAERLSWGVDPNCRSAKGTTPLIANIRSSCPNAATVRALLTHGADPHATDGAGLTALDYARRKLMRLQTKRRKPHKSPSLDENNQLQLGADEQAELDRMRQELPDADPEFFRIWWQERRRAARRAFNDPGQVEEIVSVLEAASSQG
ncbi:Ankyrin repeats (3 copies) [Gemmata sp. SH-PL17]|uniref:ankyrin repeat domain-containing protein n=1 Tax=Gemmata sp. SH-PL17 TaxID=1630693 RepID=UPI0004B093DC|nr:ankyrin repeat domain-containing protein [Gemmata sp. SH-PL17]AMV23533.1 Ankyrin repeats (3 copies) [Gemmata sp. SH-PL17]